MNARRWQADCRAPRFREEPPIALVLAMHGLALGDFRERMDAVSGAQRKPASRPFASHQPAGEETPQGCLDCRAPWRGFQQFLVEAHRRYAEARSADAYPFQ